MLRRVSTSIVLVAALALTLLSQTDFGNGNWLAFVKAGNVWVQAFPNGIAYQVSQGGNARSPSWTPLGTLTFTQNGKPADTSGGINSTDSTNRALIERSLGASSHRIVGEFLQSPDGSSFAVNVLSETSDQSMDRQGHLFRVNSDGSNPLELYTAGRMNALGIVGWSSDSREILIRLDPDFSASIAADGLALLSVPANGGPVLPLFKNVLTHPGFVSVSPHRSRILVISGGGRETWTQKRLMLADPATGQSTPLTDDKSAVAAAVWSPDASRIAYVSSPDNAHMQTGTVVRPDGQRQVRQFWALGDRANLDKRRIWIMDADGTGKRQLTNDPQYRDEYPQWSHDGQYIVFARLNAQAKASIWAIEVESGRAWQVVSEIDSPGAFGYYGYLDWNRYFAWLTQ